jgi:hypothetical protein
MISIYTSPPFSKPINKHLVGSRRSGGTRLGKRRFDTNGSGPPGAAVSFYAGRHCKQPWWHNRAVAGWQQHTRCCTDYAAWKGLVDAWVMHTNKPLLVCGLKAVEADRVISANVNPNLPHRSAASTSLASMVSMPSRRSVLPKAGSRATRRSSPRNPAPMPSAMSGHQCRSASFLRLPVVGGSG